MKITLDLPDNLVRSIFDEADPSQPFELAVNQLLEEALFDRAARMASDEQLDKIVQSLLDCAIRQTISIPPFLVSQLYERSQKLVWIKLPANARKIIGKRFAAACAAKQALMDPVVIKCGSNDQGAALYRLAYKKDLIKDK